jgi:hypothetical protein
VDEIIRKFKKRQFPCFQLNTNIRSCPCLLGGIEWRVNHSPSTYHPEDLLGKEKKKVWVSQKFVKRFVMFSTYPRKKNTRVVNKPS